ncbi:MAG: hypothetical protein HN576_03220 [Bacteriovoracaceae bacterium]|jgi:hypothetical protein|nr:hypothetical protein [Bacteriovoracaceae bacterium]
MSPGNNCNKRFKIGIVLSYLGFCVPLLVGLFNYIQNFIRYVEANFNIDELNVLIEHVAYTNLVALGIIGIVTTRYGIRNKYKWAWKLSLFLLIWSGGNDSFIFCVYNSTNLENYLFPFPYLSFIIECIALALTYQYMFKNNAEE